MIKCQVKAKLKREGGASNNSTTKEGCVTTRRRLPVTVEQNFGYEGNPNLHPLSFGRQKTDNLNRGGFRSAMQNVRCAASAGLHETTHKYPAERKRCDLLYSQLSRTSQEDYAKNIVMVLGVVRIFCF